MDTVIAILIVVAIVASVVWRIHRDANIRTGKASVVVKTVKGERAAEREIRRMLERGYQLETHGSRKVVWSPLTGVFTRKQKHTLTFVKPSVG